MNEEQLNELIINFNITPTTIGTKDFITGKKATKYYSAKENAKRLIADILSNSIKIKNNYEFQNGNEFLALLEGNALSQNKGVTYWDYIETDTLLSLQKPKTNFPDENIFIMYHQQTELYFKLIIQEINLILDLYRPKEKKIFKTTDQSVTNSIENTWIERLSRIIRYWDNLIFSFNILKDGFNTKEFNQFRKALLPASGFQTFQFRKIELMLTEIENITIPSSQKIEDLYWQKGSTKVTDKKPSKLLQNFNDKYKGELIKIIDQIKGNTLISLYEKHHKNNKIIKKLLIDLDNNILVWKIAHKQMVYKHIPKESGATGGTDYSMYLPQFIEEIKNKPIFNKNRQVLYFPKLWGDEINPNQRIKKHINQFKSKLTKTVDSTFPDTNPTGIRKTTTYIKK